MNSAEAVQRRLAQAGDLPVLLDAAYEAFEVLLSVIERHEDPAGPRFISMVMAGTCAANGRDAILFTPSLPRRRLPQPSAAAATRVQEAPNETDAAVSISELLAIRLEQAAQRCANLGDQAGCVDAAEYARQIQQLLTSSEP